MEISKGGETKDASEVGGKPVQPRSQIRGFQQGGSGHTLANIIELCSLPNALVLKQELLKGQELLLLYLDTFCCKYIFMVMT